MSSAVNAFGTILKRNGVEIAEVTDIGGPKLGRDTIEVTHHKSPNAWREKIKSLKDAGEVSLLINYIPQNSTHNATAGLLADFANETTVDTWALVFPDSAGTTWTFPAILTAFEPAEPIDDCLTASITLTISGQPTLA